MLTSLAQKVVDTSKYVPINNSNYHNEKYSPTKGLNTIYGFDGYKIVEISKATSEQLMRIKSRARLSALGDDRFYGPNAGAHENRFPRSSLAIRFEQGTGTTIYRGNQWYWGTLKKNTFIIDGKIGIEIADGLITLDNAKNYRYRIIKNDNKELVGWSIPNNFKKTTDGTNYAYLGKVVYKPHQTILIEIYNINNYKDRDAILIDWRNVRALGFWSTIEYKTKRWRSNTLSVSLGNDRRSTDQNFIETDDLSDVKFRLADSLVKLSFVSQNSPTPYNYQVILERDIKGKTEKLELGDFNGRFDLYKEYWNAPGNYKIRFTPKLLKLVGNPASYLVSPESVSYKFKVLPALNVGKYYSKRELFLLGASTIPVLVLLILIILYLVKRNNKRKLIKVQQQEALAQMQLSSIRSQLNPHFMFNALAGIQNLMNKNDMDSANRYLGKFSRLTRNVLDDKKLISLTEEKTLLDDYLQMEQLRFGFQYEISIDMALDMDNIEIPAMLLQPFVENSVKHGVANLEKEGKIAITFIPKGKDLILSLTDNGKGFDETKASNGYGLSLSKNRIALLNTLYKESPIFLRIQTDATGSKITLTLTQWL